MRNKVVRLASFIIFNTSSVVIFTILIVIILVNNIRVSQVNSGGTGVVGGTIARTPSSKFYEHTCLVLRLLQPSTSRLNKISSHSDKGVAHHFVAYVVFSLLGVRICETDIYNARKNRLRYYTTTEKWAYLNELEI